MHKLPLYLGLVLTATAVNAAPQVDNFTSQQSYGNASSYQTSSYSMPSYSPHESQDMGPIFELKPTASAPAQARQRDHQWLRITLGNQTGMTTNPTLAETNSKTSDMMVNSASVTLTTPNLEVGAGEVNFELGFSYQTYRYGLLSGENERINGTIVDSLDFDNRHAHLKTKWAMGGFSLWGSYGVDSLIEGNGNHNNFYNDHGPQWGMAYAFQLSEAQMLELGYTGRMHFTDTDYPLNLLPDDWNDRLDNKVYIKHTVALTNSLIIQPQLSMTQSHYTHSNRDRDDWLFGADLLFAWLVNDYVNLYVYTGYQGRETDETTTSDYHNFNLGLGSALSVGF